MRASDTEWLHGLRGLAVLIVIAGHLSGLKLHLVPGIDLAGISKTGVWLFFVLSAYLLARPLAEDVQRHDVAAIAAFFVKRAFRILPLYFAALYMLVQADTVTKDSAWLHAQFFAGDWHLWTMPVEMGFYFALPVFAFVGSRAAAAGVLLASIVAYLLSCPMQIGANSIFPLNYAVFFAMGIMVAYLPKPLQGWKIVLAGIAIMALTSTRSIVEMSGLSISGALTLAPFNGLGCALLLYGSISSRGFQAFFAMAWLAWLGRASFGAYLAHYHMMLALRGLEVHPALKGALIFAIIAATALAAHFVIEQPMNRLGHWIAGRFTSRACRSSSPQVP